VQTGIEEKTAEFCTRINEEIDFFKCLPWAHVQEFLSDKCSNDVSWRDIIDRWLPDVFAGDGGSSPLAASTCDIPHALPSDEEAAALLKKNLAYFLRLRRHLREVARQRAEQLQEIGLGDIGRQQLLDELRLVLILFAIVSRERAELAYQIPSRLHSASDYVLLMILKRHDPTFEKYLPILSWAFPRFTKNPKFGDGRGHEWLLIEFPIFGINDWYDWFQLGCVVKAEWSQALTQDAQRETHKDVLRAVLVLTGIGLERHETRWFTRRPFKRPHTLISFLEATDDLVPRAEQWSRWAKLVESIWAR